MRKINVIAICFALLVCGTTFAQNSIIIPPKKAAPSLQRAYEKAKARVKPVSQTSQKPSVYQRDQYGINTTQIVDLGLSVKWAEWNIGGSKPQDFGVLCGWGDPTGNMKSNLNTSYPQNKSICGTNLDIARNRWGYQWRMPSAFEMLELHNECKWQWITYNGVKGCKVTGPNGNSIFLPASGYREGNEIAEVNENCIYWSGQSDPTGKGSAFCIDLDCFQGKIERDFYSEDKYIGCPIRAVYDSNYPTIELTESDLNQYGDNSSYYNSKTAAFFENGKWGEWQSFSTRIGVHQDIISICMTGSINVASYKIVSKQNPSSDGEGGTNFIYNVTNPSGNPAKIRIRVLKDKSLQLYLEDGKTNVCFGSLIQDIN